MSPKPVQKRSACCPICGKDSVSSYRPFCSKRCADIDLGKWFSGGYAISGREEDDGDGTEAHKLDYPEGETED
jgi:uncharacterized protein